MDISSLIDGLDISPAELARRMNVSDGHVWDLKSGRRKLSLRMAAKFEEATGRTGIVAEVVKAKTSG